MVSSRRLFSVVLWMLLLSTVGASLGCKKPIPPRLVVLYAPCTVSRSYLGPYTPGVRYTPHLDRFATEGVVFENDYTEADQSGIAYAALFSGSQADHHGIYRHPQPLADEVRLIFEAF